MRKIISILLITALTIPILTINVSALGFTWKDLPPNLNLNWLVDMPNVAKEMTGKDFIDQLENSSIEGIPFIYDGKRLVYKYHSVGSIRIGNFIFPRSSNYISREDILMYSDLFVQYPLSRYNIVGFFIYENELYLPSNFIDFHYTQSNDKVSYSFPTTYVSFSHPARLEAYGSWNLDYNDFIFDGVFTYRLDQKPPNDILFDRNIISSPKVWYSLNDKLLNNWYAYQTVHEILGEDGNKSDIGSFIPRSGEFGMFVVTPDFYEITGMNFAEYILTLRNLAERDELFEQQPPTDVEEYIPLPAPLHDIKPDDKVTIEVDEEGNPVITVTNNGGGNNGGGGSSDNSWIDLFGDMLKRLFIPRDNFIGEKFENMYDTLKNKMPIFGQLQDFFHSVFQTYYDSSEDIPEFKVTIYGESVNIFDLSMFATIRPFIHGIIIFIAYYNFGRRTLRKIPKALGGIEK